MTESNSTDKPTPNAEEAPTPSKVALAMAAALQVEIEEAGRRTSSRTGSGTRVQHLISSLR